MSWAQGSGAISEFDKTDGTSIVCAVDSAFAAGSIAVLIVSMDNIDISDTVDGTDIASVTDSQGNTWARAKTRTNGQGGVAEGVTAGIYFSRLDTGLTTSDTVTVAFNGTVTASAATGLEFTCAAGMTAEVAGSFTLVGDASDPDQITISGLASQEYLFIHGLGVEGPDSDTFTQGPDYNSFSKVGTLGGLTPSNVWVAGGWRVLTGIADTVDVATGIARDHAQVYVAFKEAVYVPPPSGPTNEIATSRDILAPTSLLVESAAPDVASKALDAPVGIAVESALPDIVEAYVAAPLGISAECAIPDVAHGSIEAPVAIVVEVAAPLVSVHEMEF